MGQLSCRDPSPRSRVRFWLAGGIFIAVAALPAVQGRAERRITVDTTTRYQTIEGWGTSMIFWKLPQTPYRDPAWRRAYRDLGLNLLRVNVCKEVLVDPSGDMTVPVPLGDDLKSNIAKMSFSHPKAAVFGDMAAWLRDHALEPDRVRITGSIWSPPHWMKGPTGARQSHVTEPAVKKPTPWLSGGRDGDSIGGRLLQSPHNLEQFGRYVAAWVTGFQDHYGVPIYAVSIQNEVSFENPFDSASYSKGPNGERRQWWQYAATLKAVKDEFTAQLVATKVVGPHMAHVGREPRNPYGLHEQLRYIDAVKSHRDRELIDFLFAYNSNGYLGPDEQAVKMWAAYYHGRNAVAAEWPSWLRAPGVARDAKPIWVSEVGGAHRTWLSADGSPGMGAITVAQKIHNALVHAHASAYFYWQMSDTNEVETEHTLLGKAHVEQPVRSKKYSAFKHFSRYVRPGAVRVGAKFRNGESSIGGKSRYDTYHSLNVSAYSHEKDGMITIVIINMRPSDETVDLRLKGAAVSRLEMYLTSNEESFARRKDVLLFDGRASTTAPGYSVLTLHGKNK